MRRRLMFLLLLASAMAANAWTSNLAANAPGAGDQVLAMVGDLRTVLARLVWLQVDVYHHVIQAQGGGYNQERDVLPLLKLVTMLDPDFEEAWDVAAWHLVVGLHRTAEGLATLRAGLRHRPNSPELRFVYALLLYKTKHYRACAPAAEAAAAVAPQSTTRLECLRLAAWSREKSGDVSGARAEWSRVLLLSPHDGLAREALNRLRPNP
ncbi:MAG: tetratricopeptide repeat protein [Candidatus Xenobia bacterium]